MLSHGTVWCVHTQMNDGRWMSLREFPEGSFMSSFWITWCLSNDKFNGSISLTVACLAVCMSSLERAFVDFIESCGIWLTFLKSNLRFMELIHLDIMSTSKNICQVYSQFNLTPQKLFQTAKISNFTTSENPQQSPLPAQ